MLTMRHALLAIALVLMGMWLAQSQSWAMALEPASNICVLLATISVANANSNTDVLFTGFEGRTKICYFICSVVCLGLLATLTRWLPNLRTCPCSQRPYSLVARLGTMVFCHSFTRLSCFSLGTTSIPTYFHDDIA